MLPTQNTPDAVVALPVTSHRNDLCLRTSPLSVQSMALADLPPLSDKSPAKGEIIHVRRGAGSLPVRRLNITVVLIRNSPMKLQRIHKSQRECMLNREHTHIHMLWCVAAAHANTQKVL